MKSMIKLPLLAVAVALAVPFTFAQNKETPPPPPPGEHGAQEGVHKGPPRGDRFKQIAEKLQLTEEQKTKIKPIIEEEMKEMAALRDDKSLERKARRDKAVELHKKYSEQIRPLLTPEQQKKLEDMKDDFGGRGPGGPGGPRKEKAKE